MPETPELKWWGWGREGEAYPPEKAQAFLRALLKALQLPMPEETPCVDLAKISVPGSELSQDFLQKWSSRGLSLATRDRILHACGRSYRDLLRLRSGTLSRFPDGVLHLQKSEDLSELFSDAVRFGVSLIPFGGGTGVVGGTECLSEGEKPVLVIDLKGLNHLLSLDEVARTATFQAGILGPDLEKILNQHGMSLGHFPQSFEFSTLGGWVVTRSAGQNSTQYGKIEDMVEGVTLVAPAGSLRTKSLPASATGPSLKEVIVGSEGLYGIVTEAVVRIHPLPESKRFVAALMPGFEEGVEAVREFIQQGFAPSIVRLSDAEETSLSMGLLTDGSSFKEMIFRKWFGFRDGTSCFLLIGLEGGHRAIEREAAAIAHLLKKRGGRLLPGDRTGAHWEKNRFRLPYLRDDLMDRGILIDTLETATEWPKVPLLRKAVLDAIRETAVKEGTPILAGCHLSHAYATGASLYFTLLGPQKKGDELGQWERLKTAATDALMKNGGALSHHHGIGYDHRRWMKEEHGEFGIKIFRRIKSEMDPEGLLNPGKLIP